MTGPRFIVQLGDLPGVVLGTEDVVIGRDAGAGLRSANLLVSRRHARITQSGAVWRVEDLGSTHGLHLDGQRVPVVIVDRPMSIWIGPPGSGDRLTITSLGSEDHAERSGRPSVEIGETVSARERGPLYLVVMTPHDERRMRVAVGRFVVGRDPQCDLRIDDDEISARHVQIEVTDDGRAYVEDLGSRNGTLLDGKVLRGRAELGDGSVMRMGRAMLSASWHPDANLSAQRAGPSPSGTSISRLRDEVSLLRRRQSSKRTIGLMVGATAVGLAIGVAALLLLLPREPAVAEVIEAVAPSTVSILGELEPDVWIANGSGWVYDAEEGLIVTNFHVVELLDRIAVGVNAAPRVARLVAVAECEDLALLRLDDTSGLQAMSLGRQDEVRQGDRVVALGFPDSLGPVDAIDLTATSGVVSVVRKDIVAVRQDNHVYRDVIQTDAAVNPGNSGGPLVNSRMQLIGVNTWSLTSSILTGRDIEGQGYAIGVDHVREVIPRLRTGESIPCGS